MADTILIKRSLTPGSVPTTASLQEGELALNIADKLIYTVSGSEVVSLNSIEAAYTGSYRASQINLVAQDGILSITGSTLLGIFNETANVDPLLPIEQFSGASIEYNAQRTGAARFGTLMASWSGSEVVHTDNSTTDIGETWDLSFDFIRSGDNIRLRAYSLGSGSGGWNIGFTMKLFPNLL
jgi:hypothetical protein